MRIVLITLGWAAGIVLADRFAALVPAFWLFALTATITSLWLAWRTPHRLLAVFCVALTLGGLRYQAVPQQSHIAQFIPLGGATVEGIIVDAPDVRDQRVQVRLRSEHIFYAGYDAPTSGDVLVYLPRETIIAYGDRVQVTGLLTQPGRFDNFSYREYLARRDIFVLMRNATAEVLAHDQALPFWAGLFRLRQHLSAQIARALPEPEAGLLTGILLGNERGIAPDVDEAFQRTGAAHIIAISGFNMVIIGGWIMSFAQRWRRYRWLFIGGGSLLLVLYSLLAGADAAVLRAAFMTILAAIGQALDRDTYVPASLAFAALVFSLLDPGILWDVGFQLSFVAVLGLTLLQKPLEAGFRRLLRALMPTQFADTLANVVREPLLVTVAASSLTIPLIALYFGRVSLASFVVNLLIVPVQAPLLLIGLLAALASLVFFPLAQLLFWIDYALLSWSIGIVRFFGGFAWADQGIFVRPELIGTFFSLVLVAMMIEATRPKWINNMVRLLQITLLIATFATAVVVFQIIRKLPDGHLHLWWLDVGHSNAILLQSPEGAHVLIDGGRNPTQLLTALGDRLPITKRHLEAVIITQPDENDIAALTAVYARYSVGMTILHGQPNETEVYQQVLEAAQRESRIELVQAGWRLQLGDGPSIDILHPSEQPRIQDRLNDQNLVLRITYGQFSTLLPGDLSLDGQQRLLASDSLAAATVLQLPNHGTNRSLNPALLEAVQPRLLVLQSDAGNLRGDPAVDTLWMLPPEVPLLRTDVSGTIHLHSDGHSVVGYTIR